MQNVFKYFLLSQSYSALNSCILVNMTRMGMKEYYFHAQED